jgi:hypothetical protein
MPIRAFRIRAQQVCTASALALIASIVSGCGPRDSESSAATTNSNAPAAAAVLLFAGTGTSPNDVKSIESIMKNHHLDYAKVDSAQLNGMDVSQLRQYRLLIVPGGNFEQMGKGLSPNAAANIRGAVQNGVNYLGICGGAFMAGNSPYNGLNLTGGVRFGFYSVENQGIRKAAVSITVPGAPTLEHYWEDGPQLTGWGTVVGKYPDGTPAITQGNVGTGWMILSGVHPEAPENWRGGMTFSTPARVDNEYAWTLIEAALNRTSLPHY